MKIYVDIDGTIFKRRMNRDYEKSKPISDRINKINKLYDDGHEICYWTARGTVSGIDWHELTKKQLYDAGAKYHKLIMGKPEYDIFIDDKNINALVLDDEDPLESTLLVLETNKKVVI